MSLGAVSAAHRYEMMGALAGLPHDNLMGVTVEISLLSAGTELNASGTGYGRAFQPTGYPSAVTWARSGTTATVTTSANHKLVTGDTVEITDSSDLAAITNSTKTITVTGPTTFTFTCLNAGGTSGTATLYPPPFWARDVDSGTGDTTLVQQRDITFPAASGADWLYDELRIHPYGGAGTWIFQFPTTEPSTVRDGDTLTIPAGTLRVPDLSSSAGT